MPDLSHTTNMHSHVYIYAVCQIWINPIFNSSNSTRSTIVQHQPCSLQYGKSILLTFTASHINPCTCLKSHLWEAKEQDRCLQQLYCTFHTLTAHCPTGSNCNSFMNNITWLQHVSIWFLTYTAPLFILETAKETLSRQWGEGGGVEERETQHFLLSHIVPMALILVFPTQNF